MLVVGLLSGCGDARAHVEAPSPSAGDRSTCANVLAALPSKVADQSRHKDDATWGAAWGDPPITLACGVERPSGFTRGSPCTTVNHVDWYIPEAQLDATRPVDLTLTTVYRKAYLQLELPKDYWPPATALADLSHAVTEADPATGHCG